jgi:hypothetical protein
MIKIKILMSSAAIAPLLFAAPAAFAQSQRHSGDQTVQTSSEEPGSPHAKREHEGGGEHQMQKGGARGMSRGATAQSDQGKPQSKSEEGTSQSKGAEAKPQSSGKESVSDHEHKPESKTGRSAETTQRGAKEGAQSGAKNQQPRSAETHGSDKGEAHRGTAAENSAGKGSHTGEKTNAATESRNGRSGESGNAKANAETNHGHEAKRLEPAKQQHLREAVSKEHVKNITHVDFSVHVGTVVPGHYHFYPLPEDVVSFVPEYRGYDYIVVDDEIVIVEPGTHRIVYTLPETQTAEYNHRSVDCR